MPDWVSVTVMILGFGAGVTLFAVGAIVILSARRERGKGDPLV
jgi:hypothetical protein